MNVHLKIDGRLLDDVRKDLHRPHAFAHERVGFFTAGAAGLGDRLLLTIRNYMPVIASGRAWLRRLQWRGSANGRS